MKIARVVARMILDSRAHPTIEVDVSCDGGGFGRAAVPAGASTGKREAVELRDGGTAWLGMGVSRAIANVHDQIAPRVIGQDCYDQAGIDQTMMELDGTDNKSHLGANAILAVSLAVARAAASADHLPLYEYIAKLAGNNQFSLPLPLVNVINGGQHAAGSTDIQEFMLIPIGADSFSRAVQMTVEVYGHLGRLLHQNGYPTTLGDEGGYAPAFAGKHQEALDLLVAAIEAARYQVGTDFGLGLDVAASELVDGNSYSIDGQKRSSEAMISWYEQLADHYPLMSLEDGLGQDDWGGWRQLNLRLGQKLQLVGDDLLVTNVELLEQAIEQQAANAILIKPNQIGTLTETIAAVQAAKQAGWRTIISHRSGETEDTTIAHLAVGLNTGQIKTGSVARSERTAKYNELMRIAEHLGDQAKLSHPFNRG